MIILRNILVRIKEGLSKHFPPNLQLTISVCLAVRVPIDSHPGWAFRKKNKRIIMKLHECGF